MLWEFKSGYEHEAYCSLMDCTKSLTPAMSSLTQNVHFLFTSEMSMKIFDNFKTNSNIPHGFINWAIK